MEVPSRDDNGTTRRIGRVVHELFAAEEAARVSGVEHGALLNMGRHLTDLMANLADFEDFRDEPPPAPESPPAPTESKFPPLSSKEGEKQCRRYYTREVGETGGRETKRSSRHSCTLNLSRRFGENGDVKIKNQD